MKTKKRLLKDIDAAIKNELTAPENKELLIEIKLELEAAKTKKEYFEIATKVVNIISTVAKIFTGSG